MISESIAPNLQRVLTFVVKNGAEAVLDGDSVVICNIGPQVESERRYVSGRVHRVRTLAEAWAALEMCGLVRERRLVSVETQHHYRRPIAASA